MQRLAGDAILPVSDDALLVIQWRDAPGHRIEAVSPGVLTFLGRSADSLEALGLSVPDIVHPQDRERFQTEIAKARRCGHDRVRHADHRVVGRDGRVAWWQTVTILRPEPGGIVRCVSHAFDITGTFGCPMPETRQPSPCAERVLLQALIDSIPDLIFFKDTNSVYLGCNRAFAAFVQKTGKEIVGRTDFDLAPHDLAATFQEHDREMLRTRTPRRIEETVRFPDGRTALLETIKTPYYGPSSEVLGLVAVARDVTDKANTQRELHESERRLATLLGNLPGMAYRCRADAAWTMLFASEGCRQLTGYGPEELTGGVVGYGNLVHPDDRARIAEEMQSAIGRHRRFTLTYRIVDRSGELKHVWEQGVGVLGEGGVLEAVEGFITDITELKTAEESLRTLSLAVAQSPVAVVITDALGKVAYVNPRFTAMTGQDLSSVPDLEAFALSFTEPGTDHFRAMWRVLSGGETWHGELPARRADGGFFWASVTIAPVRDTDGRITNFIGTADDVTERRQAEEHIRRAQKMQAVGVLAGGIAHDFNNILTAILGYSHLALDSLPEGSEVRDDVAQVTVAADRAKGLVQQLLTFSRKEKVGREAVDLRTVVEEALQLVQPTVPLDVTLRFLCDEGSMPVLAAPTQIHQVVVNLCKNAVDAIGGDDLRSGGDTVGEIVVSLAHAAVGAPKELARARLNPGRYVCLTVADTGSGMDAAMIDRIFEPFFTTKAVDKGTGLGLAAVHGIVADHGGVIDVVSATGQGSSFSIYLPQHDPNGPHRAADRGRGRILLIDDERTMLSMAGRLLRSQEFQVVASASSRRGLALFTIAPERFDLVVLAQSPLAQTWKLLTLARAFAAAAPGMPILVCADPDSDLEGAAIEAAGVSRILRTPVVPDQFVTLAGQLVDERLAQK